MGDNTFDGTFNLTNSTTSDLQRQIIGWVYVSFAGVDIIFYAITLFFMATDKKLMEGQFFKFVIHMGVADLGQISCNSFGGGVLTLINGYNMFWVNSLASAFLGWCWFTYLSLAHTMAFNRFVKFSRKINIYRFYPFRFVSICRPRKLPIWFSNGRTNAMIFCSWAIGAIFFCLYMLPTINFLYDPRNLCFIYENNPPTKALMAFHLIVSFLNLFGMLFWYGVTYHKLRKQVFYFTCCFTISVSSTYGRE